MLIPCFYSSLVFSLILARNRLTHSVPIPNTLINSHDSHIWQDPLWSLQWTTYTPPFHTGTNWTFTFVKKLSYEPLYVWILTRWTWVWINSRIWWWTRKPGMLQSMGSQRFRHDWVTELVYEYTQIYIYMCVCVCVYVYTHRINNLVKNIHYRAGCEGAGCATVFLAPAAAAAWNLFKIFLNRIRNHPTLLVGM